MEVRLLYSDTLELKSTGHFFSLVSTLAWLVISQYLHTQRDSSTTDKFKMAAMFAQFKIVVKHFYVMALEYQKIDSLTLKQYILTICCTIDYYFEHRKGCFSD